MIVAREPENHRYALLGSGRLARHLVHYFRAEGIEANAWARQPDPAFNTVDVTVYPDPRARLEAAIEPCTHALLLISDDALESFIREHDFLQRKILIHCSGALVLKQAHSAHPLMTFSHALYEPEVYRRIPFVTEANGPGFSELFPALSNPSYALAPEKKALYHAYCVVSGNFTGLLWERVFREFETELGLPKAALLPYMECVFANLASDDGVVTGPLVRKDMQTIRCDLRALSDNPLRDLYEAFLRLCCIALPPMETVARHNADEFATDV